MTSISDAGRTADGSDVSVTFPLNCVYDSLSSPGDSSQHDAYTSNVQKYERIGSSKEAFKCGGEKESDHCKEESEYHRQDHDGGFPPAGPKPAAYA